MDKMISCEFNIDTACVEVRFVAGRMISILNSTNFDTYKIIPDYIKHHLQKSHGILKKMLAFLCEVYYNRDILNPRKQGFVWH